MKVHYWRAPFGNFGDDLNEWLWRELMPNHVHDCDEIVLVGIGTIINEHIPKSRKTLVFGSGVGYGKVSNLDTSTWKFYCVRGPISARTLGLDPSLAVSDGAMLIRCLSRYSDLPSGRSGIAFMPHLSSSLSGCWERVCGIAGIKYLDPRRDSKELIMEIGASEIVLAEAMHGAIVADCLRVPWVPIVTSNEISTLKWVDWLASIDLKYEPILIGGSSVFETLRNQKRALINHEGHYQSLRSVDDIILNGERPAVDSPMLHGGEMAAKRSERHPARFGGILSGRAGEVIASFTKFAQSSRFVHASRKLDLIFQQRAAGQLRKAAKRPPLLSDDRIFGARLTRMRDLLEQLRADLGSKRPFRC